MDLLVRSFEDINQSDVSIVGGKGANLGEMTRAGFPVPQGFCVTTAAYQAFLQTSSDMPRFFAQLESTSASDLSAIQALGVKIRCHLESLPIPRPI